ncbi:MAG: CheR family methyltransferase [Verrucomicrobiota bacterium]
MTCADPIREIEAILNRGIGLDPQSMGSPLIAAAVRARMNRRSFKDLAAYAEVLAASETEFQGLVEEIVVPETWFFREPAAFALLGQWAVQTWLPEHAYGVLRILSAPCSTGEEPFSIVMALLDAGLPPERFSVEAVDISAAALEKAGKALYGRNAFRTASLEFRERHFQKSAGGWRLNETLRGLVRFRQVNVFDAAFAHKEEELDVIFCRNMMIYFDAPARERLMKALRTMISPHGMLFLGHAEGGIAREAGFEPIPSPMTFAFCKSRVAPAAPPPRRKAVAAAPPLVSKPGAPQPLPPLPAPVVRRRRAKEAAPAAVPVAAETLLAEAERLADAGRFQEAQAACAKALQAQGPSARTYYLLGLISDAAADAAGAEAFYRKTLYLEPDHYEALVQLSLLEKKRGDAKAARQLDERAGRARRKNKTP